jgi:hypothetical protein
MSAAYTWEKCHLAVSTLAAGTGSLRDRLGDAWWYSLDQLTSSPIPWDDLQAKLGNIEERLTPEISANEVPRMNDDGLRALAKEIVDLFDDVCRRYAIEQSAS